MKFHVFLLTVFLSIVSIPIFAQVYTCPSNDFTPKSCPRTYGGFPFVAAYYLPPFWEQQIPPTISCNYGTKRSYKVYYQHIFCMPASFENLSAWVPDPSVRGAKKCLVSDPNLCSFISYKPSVQKK